LATDERTVERYNRRARLVHAATYVLTFVLLGTGWWLATGHEGQPSILARLLRTPDTEVHRLAGYGLTAVVAAALTIGVRGAITFVRQTVRINRGDMRWFLSWPAGALRGRFAPHRGHFDPGQRVANVAFVVVLGVLIVSGLALVSLKGGPTFAAMVRIHRAATYALAILIVVHVVLAVGILPGYRGAWRSMHGRGRVRVSTARRLWPASVPDDHGRECLEIRRCRAGHDDPGGRPADRATASGERARARRGGGG
jgi:formate dehydrogenase subunit gamma